MAPTEAGTSTTTPNPQWRMIADSIMANVKLLEEEGNPMADPHVLAALVMADNELDSFVCNLPLEAS